MVVSDSDCGQFMINIFQFYYVLLGETDDIRYSYLPMH
jgi:hypothetical protein